MSNLCFICSKSLTEGDIVVVERGMKTLIDSSVERNDGFFEYLSNSESVTIHTQCRKMYTRKSSIAAVKRQRDIEQASTSKMSKISPPRTRAQLSEPDFSFKNYCFFCGNNASEEAEKKQPQKCRRKICKVSTLEFKESIMKIARSRSDDTAKNVIARIEYVYDLVAAEAKYHINCYNSFLRPTTGVKSCRPQNEAINSAMDKIFTYIENSDDCQFSLDELKNICEIPTIDSRTIKMRLKLKYGNKIILTEKPGKVTFICFIDNQHHILNKAWYENKKSNEKEEKFRFLKAAAAIIREDIQSLTFDNSDYPSPNRMFEDIYSVIPESLTYFLEKLILKNKRFKLEHFKLVCTNISHIIMTAIRPRSFKSKLQLGLSIFFHRRFGSKRLIEIFSSLGLCASYTDTMLYEAAAVFHKPPHILPPETGTCIQYVADNADINVHTLDGHNTLHVMGIIQIVTPKNSFILEEPIASE